MKSKKKKKKGNRAVACVMSFSHSITQSKKTYFIVKDMRYILKHSMRLIFARKFVSDHLSNSVSFYHKSPYVDLHLSGHLS